MEGSSFTSPPGTVSSDPSRPTTSPTSHYAFLVHSQTTLKNTLPPNVDNESVVRQKRRRTSPEDQAILESEFEKDAKPDRAARKAIANRVKGMGEKEVQIWFQNRRQNIRRRSRPLLPDEIPQLVSSDPSSRQDDPDYEEALPQELCEPQAQHDSNLEAAHNETVSNGKPREAAGEVPDLVQSSESSPPNTQDSTISDSVRTKRPDGDSHTSRRSLKRSLSGKRISLTSDGSAKILDDDESSPSPPRPFPQMNASPSAPLITRSSGGGLVGSGDPFPQVRRIPSGRSRDSRAWEFFCDTDAPSELAMKAEQEQSGDAAAAIKLMRVGSRGNLATQPPKRGPKPSQTRKAQKPALERSKTSMARLENPPAPTFDMHEDAAEAQQGSLLSNRFVKSPTGESDKENGGAHRHEQNLYKRRAFGDGKEPDTRARKAQLKMSASVPGRSALGTLDTHTSGRGRSRRNPPGGSFSKENVDPEDDEVARFMSSGKGHSSMSLVEEQDMDVIQGLLSLSKGS